MDINVLIALLDGTHAFHDRAHTWWKANDSYGWASCPLTENGVVRIMTNPAFSPTHRFTVDQIVAALRQFVAATDHKFWPDNLSLRDAQVFKPEQILGGRQVTDRYLLGLAVTQGGRLVTFDQAITRLRCLSRDIRRFVHCINRRLRTPAPAT